MTELRSGEGGVVLVNVLAILALTAAVVTAMVRIADVSILRSQRYSDAAQALALIAAAEASAVVALRRDMVEGPGSDHPGEAWAEAAQEPVQIEAGAFALRIEDAQARINLNGLFAGGVAGGPMLSRMIAVLDLPPDVALRVGVRLAQSAPLARIEDLIPDAGLTADEVVRLSRVATAISGRGPVNLNTAPVEVLRILASNPVQALRLDGVRSRQGYLTTDDVQAAGMVVPVGAGFTSQLFRVTITVRAGDMTLTIESLLQRRQVPGSGPEVVVIDRSPGKAALF